MEDIKRKRIIEFLQWNDKNGCYTDEGCEIEKIPVMTYKDAVKYFFGVMNDDEYYKVADNIFELEYEYVIHIAKSKQFFDRTMYLLEELQNEEVPTVEFYKKLIK